MKKFDNEQEEFDRVVDLLTPHFTRSAKKTAVPSISHRKPSRLFRFCLMGGAAAAVLLIITFTLNFRLTASPTPEEIVNRSLDSIENASSFKINFTLRAVRVNNDDIYDSRPEGKLMKGTLYILEKDGNTCNRVDWHDAEKNSIVYDGKNYFHFQDGKIKDSHPSTFHDKLRNLLYLNWIKENMPGFTITERGDKIVLFWLKDNIKFEGIFSRSAEKLEKASVKANQNGEDLMMLETESIDYGIDLPESLFRP